MKDQSTIMEAVKGKDMGKILSIIGLCLIALPFIIFPVMDTFAAKEYHPLTPAAQSTYDSANLTFCNAEKALAGAKLMDIANGVKMEADLNALAVKRDMACEGF